MRVLPIPLLQRRFRLESIREVVFGVEDGAVQNMALIAGMVGATLTNAVILLAGSINVIAGVLSMAMGTYLSSQAERDALLAAAEESPPMVRSPLRDAMVMGGAYTVGGFTPLMAFALPFVDRGTAAIVAIVLTGGVLFGLGVLKAAVSGRSRWRSGLQLLALASTAGVAGYLIGVVAQAVFGIAV